MDAASTVLRRRATTMPPAVLVLRREISPTAPLDPHAPLSVAQGPAEDDGPR